MRSQQVDTRRLPNYTWPDAPLHLFLKSFKTMQSSSNEIALALRRLAEMVQAGGSAIIQLSGETIFIPSKADVSCKYESGAASRELSIRVTWAASLSTPRLVRQHGERVQDTLGNLYEVFIYGEPRLDGTWEGWLEFVSLDPALLTRRTERETTQPDLPALEYWATGLEPLYLAGAFERAI